VRSVSTRVVCKRALTLLLVVTMTELLAAVPASAASAAVPRVGPQSFWGCPDGFSCYYDGEYGAGRKWVAPSCGFFNLGDPHVVNPVFNDKITSINNDGNGDVRLYNWIGSWQWVGTVPAHSEGSWVGKLKPSVNNIVDAVEIDC
jgi:hypothetical protein